jgi:predicted DsbA family dithiol-disulfide isomerase
MAAADGIRFTPWEREDFPAWSLPALEAAKCVARQGAALFERLHLALYEAFFTRGRNIAQPDELMDVAAEAGADMERLAADLRAGVGREAVLRDWQQAVTRDHVRAIPTIIVDGGPRLTGLMDLAAYRAALAGA